MQRFTRVSALVVSFALVASERLPAQEVPGLSDALPVLDEWVATAVAQRGQPGLSIGVVLGDKLTWAKGYGHADVEKKIAATPRTLYQVGSITKMFTAVAILQLRDAHKLKLDDPLRQHLKETRIRAYDPKIPDVTLRQLLTHSSGLQREVPGTYWTEIDPMPSPENLRAEFKQIYLSGTQWKYSNLGFVLLGEVVTAVSGEPWDRYVQGRILNPLRMAATRPIPRRAEANMATGYSRPAPGATHVRVASIDLATTGPAGSLASSVEDLALYVAFHLNEGATGSSPVLSGASLRDMHRPHWLHDDWQNAWGLGVRVRRVDGRVRVGHGGSVPGYTASVEFIPSLGLGVIALTNAGDGAPAAYTDYALQLLTPIVAKAKSSAAARPQDAGRYVGRYQSSDGRTTLLVALLDGQLSLVAPDAGNPYSTRVILEPAGEPHTFIMRWTGLAFSAGQFGETVMFELGQSGQVTGYSTPNGRYRRIGSLP